MQILLTLYIFVCLRFLQRQTKSGLEVCKVITGIILFKCYFVLGNWRVDEENSTDANNETITTPDPNVTESENTTTAANTTIAAPTTTKVTTTVKTTTIKTTTAKPATTPKTAKTTTKKVPPTKKPKALECSKVKFQVGKFDLSCDFVNNILID